MAIVKGNRLTANMQRVVLATYTYRFTMHNQPNEAYWQRQDAPDEAKILDDLWLATNDFYLPDNNPCGRAMLMDTF